MILATNHGRRERFCICLSAGHTNLTCYQRVSWRIDFLLRVAEEFGEHRIAGVPIIEKAGIRHDAAHEVVERLVVLDRFHQALSAVCFRKCRQFALIGLGEALALGLGAREIGRKARRTHRRIKIGEIPLRQNAERGSFVAGSGGLRRARASVGKTERSNKRHGWDPA